MRIAFTTFVSMLVRPFIALFIFVFMQAPAQSQNPPGFETMLKAVVPGKADTVSSQQLHAMILQKNVILLDAREYKEYIVSHIDGAIHVGYEDFELTRIAHLDKRARIVVYCSVGKRSDDIAAKLMADGYISVYNHWGGIFDWTNRGYTVVNNNGDPVNQVHPYNSFWAIWINRCEKVYEPR